MSSLYTYFLAKYPQTFNNFKFRQNLHRELIKPVLHGYCLPNLDTLSHTYTRAFILSYPLQCYHLLQHNSMVLWTNTVHKSDFENAPQRWSLFAQTKGNRKFSHLGQKHAQNMFLEKLCLSSWCIFKFVFFLSKLFSFTTHTVQVV